MNIRCVLLLIISTVILSCNSDENGSSCDHENFETDVYKILDTDIGAISGIVLQSDQSVYTQGNGRTQGIFLNFQLTKVNEQLEVVWSKEYGGDNVEQSHDLILTRNNGLLMCGSSNSFDNGSTNAYLVKVDESGNEEWSNWYGTTNSDKAIAAMQLEDESFIIGGLIALNGSTGTDELLFRIDKDGNELWFQNNNYSFRDRITDIKRTIDGQIFVLCSRSSSNGFGNDIILKEIDLDGNIVWESNIGVSAESVFKSELQITNDNHLIVGSGSSKGPTGSDSDYMLIKVNFQGEIQWSNTYNSGNRDAFKSVIQLEDNNYLVVGDSQGCNGNISDMFLLKIDSLGDLIWMKSYGNKIYEAVKQIVEINNNEYLVSGHIEGNDTSSDFDLLMFKVDSNGNPK